MPKVPRQPAHSDAPPLSPEVPIDGAARQPSAQGLGRRSTGPPGRRSSPAHPSRQLEAAAQHLPEPEQAAARAAFAQRDLAAL